MDFSELGQWLGIGSVAVGITVWAIRLEGRVTMNSDRLDRGDRKLESLTERDDGVLRALNELRVSVARLEEKIDRQNGAR